VKAVLVSGGKLVWADTDDPGAPGPGEVRIAVVATAVNRADLAQRLGVYPPPPGASPVLGLECSGHVEAVGAGVANVSVGDAVCALLAGGGYASRVVCPAVQCLRIPRGLTLEQAAAIPEVWTTAWLNLWREGRLAPNERVLVHAGASGVGTAAIQLCGLAGNPVAVTVGSDEKAARCVALGASLAVNRKAGPWRDAVRAWGAPAVILDPVGGDYLEDDLAVLAYGGRLVFIGIMGGTKAPLDLGRLLMKRQQITGSTLRSRPPEEKGELLRGLEQAAWAAFATGAVRPIIDRVLPIAQADEAHALVASDVTFGKVVLTVPDA
jgi:putative PIG3 family NAD(P)H quinone oxidoreductase